MFQTFEWSPQKNLWLMQNRKVCFEQIVAAINDGRLLDVVEHSNRQKYAGQKVMIVEIDHYAYLVPFIYQPARYFLKTIIPSRKATRRYLKGSAS
jgi:hypothetical protein